MICFRVSFTVEDGSKDDFVRMVAATYGPALARQPGYLGHRLLEPYAAGPAWGASPGMVKLELEFEFDSEESRQAWAASEDHRSAWDAAVRLSRSQASCGYQVLLSSGTQTSGSQTSSTQTGIDSPGGKR